MLGGVAAHLFATLKNNALLIKKRKSLDDIDKLYGGKAGHTELIIRHTTPEELKAFHEKLAKEKRRANIIQILLVIVFVAVAVLGTYFLIQGIS